MERPRSTGSPPDSRSHSPQQQAKQRQLDALRQSLRERGMDGLPGATGFVDPGEVRSPTPAGAISPDAAAQAADAASSDTGRMTKAVQVALLRVLWQAVHSRRSLFGTICHDLPTFFAAVDRSSTGMLSQEELRDAFARLDVGLTDTQLDRLMATVDTAHSGRIDFVEFERWMLAGGLSSAALPESPLPWNPVAAVHGATFSAGRTDHLPTAQISTDSSGWKEVLGGTAVARGRARGNAALGRASRNGEVALDGVSSPWRQRTAGGSVSGHGTPPRQPRSPSVASSPDSLFADTAGLSPPMGDARVPVRQAWSDGPRAVPEERTANGAAAGSSGWSSVDDESDDALSEADLEAAARLYEETAGRAATEGSRDPPLSARDGWELCCGADSVEYWFNFQTGERRAHVAVEQPREESVEQPRAVAPQPTSTSAVVVAVDAAEAKWQREQRWRELATMEEEQRIAVAVAAKQAAHYRQVREEQERRWRVIERENHAMAELDREKEAVVRAEDELVARREAHAEAKRRARQRMLVHKGVQPCLRAAQEQAREKRRQQRQLLTATSANGARDVVSTQTIGSYLRF